MTRRRLTSLAWLALALLVPGGGVALGMVWLARRLKRP